MIGPRLLSQTAVIYSRSQTESDSEGDVVTTTTERTVRCLLQRVESRAAAEEDFGRSLAVGEWVLFLEAGTPIDADDSVLVDGVRYEVEGDPDNVIDPLFGGVHHIEARLRRVG